MPYIPPSRRSPAQMKRTSSLIDSSVFPDINGRADSINTVTPFTSNSKWCDAAKSLSERIINSDDSEMSNCMNHEYVSDNKSDLHKNNSNTSCEDEEHAQKVHRVVNGMVSRWQGDRDAINELLGEASPYWDARPFGEETDDEEAQYDFSDTESDQDLNTWNDGP